jgi:hypothetical protein
MLRILLIAAVFSTAFIDNQASAQLVVGRALGPIEVEDELGLRPWHDYRHDLGNCVRGKVLRIELPGSEEVLNKLDKLSDTGPLSLDLSGPGVDDDVLKAISGLKRLEHLLLLNTSVTDAGLTHLRDLPALRELEILGALVTSDGVETLSSHQKLEKLAIAECRLDKNAAAHIAKLTSLKELMLLDTNLVDESMVHLSKLKNLRNLTLMDSPITDAGLEQLTKLDRLHFLVLTGTKVTDDGLAQFQAFKRLWALRFGTSEQITTKGMSKIGVMEHLRHGLLTAANRRNETVGQTAFRTLDESTTVEFSSTPISDVAEYLSDLHGISIELSAEFSRPPLSAATVSAELRDLPLRSALDWICEQSDLAWQVKPKGLLISTRKSVADQKETRTWDVAEPTNYDRQIASGIATALTDLVAPGTWRDGRKRSIEDFRVTAIHNPIVLSQIDSFLEDLSPRSGRARQSVATQRILRALDAPSELTVERTSIMDAFESLADVHRIPIKLDRAAMIAHGISANQVLTCKLKDMPLRALLEHALSPLKLTWAVRHEMLVVYPQAKEHERMFARAYHVAPLLGEDKVIIEVAADLADRFQLNSTDHRCAPCYNRLAIRATPHEHELIEKYIRVKRGW